MIVTHLQHVTFFSRLQAVFSEHWGVLPHALAMAFLIAAPLIFFPFAAKESYRGINIAHFEEDQLMYLSRGREILDGNDLGNSLLQEGKNKPDPFLTWNERVLLAPYRWLGVGQKINVSSLYISMNAVGIFILVILIYLFTYQLSGNKPLSVLISVFVIGGYSLIFYRTFFYENMNIYGRASSPYLSSIGLFTYLNLLIRSLNRPRIRTGIAAAIMFGILFYVYLFAWTYVLTLNIVLIGVYLLWHDFNKVKTLAVIIGGGLLIGVYALKILLLDTENGTKYFQLAEHTHAPLFSNVGAVLLVILGIYWWKNRTDTQNPLFLAFILSGWVVLNQQILTGLRIQPGHYYWYFVVPVGIILSIFLVWKMVKPTWRPAYCVILFLAVYVNTLGGQYKSFMESFPRKLDDQRFALILETLQKNTKPSVVLTSGNDKAYFVTIFTRHDIFWHDGANFYTPDDVRMRESLSVWLALNSEARQNMPLFIEKVVNNKLPPSSYFYTKAFNALEGFTSGLDFYEFQRQIKNNDPAILMHRRELIEKLSHEAIMFAADPNKLEEVLKKYHVDYVVWDKEKTPEWDVSIIPGLHEILSDQEVVLYGLNSL